MDAWLDDMGVGYPPPWTFSPRQLYQFPPEHFSFLGYQHSMRSTRKSVRMGYVQERNVSAEKISKGEETVQGGIWPFPLWNTYMH